MIPIVTAAIVVAVKWLLYIGLMASLNGTYGTIVLHGFADHLNVNMILSSQIS